MSSPQNSNLNSNSNSDLISGRVTWEGCSVLLDINDGERLVFARLAPAASLKMGKDKCPLSPLVGAPFGSLFRVETGKLGTCLSPITHPQLPQLGGDDVEQKDDDDDDIAAEEMRDNRGLVDNNTAQLLSSQDIDVLRREGATGDQIVEALIANSATFDNKTAYSQEKYRLRKQRKYAPRVLLRRPFARTICEAYFKKHPNKIGSLRVDTLSLLLSLGNPTVNSDILLFDMVGGLVTGAVAERKGGSGYVCNTFLGATEHPMGIVGVFNLSDEARKRILRCSLDDLCPTQNGTCEQNSPTESTCKTSKETTEQLTSGDPSTCEVNTEEDILAPVPEASEIIPEENCTIRPKACRSGKTWEMASEELIKSWKERGFSSLIVAAPELSPWTLVQKLLPLLSYSAPFAIYHPYLQPLTACLHNLRTEKMAINLEITEPWLREYQVLPSRTHPCMQMSAFGGYILSGIRICGAESHDQI